MDAKTDRQADGWMNAETNGLMDELMHRWMDACMDRQMN